MSLHGKERQRRVNKDNSHVDAHVLRGQKKEEATDDAHQVIEEERCRDTVPEDRGPQGRRDTKVEGKRRYPVQTDL